MSADNAAKLPADAQASGSALTEGLRSRPIVIQNVWPELDCGRYPVKREVGDALEVSAEIFRDGHDKLTAVILLRRKDQAEWREVPMAYVNPGLDQWSGSVVLEDNTSYVYTIEAWTDAYESWCGELEKKLEAKQVVSLELIEGKALIADAAGRAKGSDAERMSAVLTAFDGADDTSRAAQMLDASLRAAMGRWPDRSGAARYDRELEVFVDRIEARFAAWYEMFHRSQGTEPGVGATFYDCEERLPAIKAMGFDVV